MAINNVILGANWASASFQYLPPVRSGLQFWYNLGGSLGASVIDHGPLAKNGSFVGVGTGTALVTPQAGYCTIDNRGANNNYCNLVSQFIDTNGQDLTLCVVCRSSDTFVGGTDQPVFLTSYLPDTANPILTGLKGSGISVSASTGAPECSLQFHDQWDNAGSLQAANCAVTLSSGLAFNTNFKVFVATVTTVSGSTTRMFYDLTDGLTGTTGATSGERMANMTNPYQLGTSGNSNGSGGLADIAVAAAWNRCLSSTEINSYLYPALKAYMNQFGHAV